jgi:hypothetical protein
MVEVTEADREAAAKAPMTFISAGGKTAYDAICKMLATHRIEAAKAERDRLLESDKLRFGSPPEPVANPSASWCEEYARWYYQESKP